MPNYGGTSSGMDDLDSWGGGSSGNFSSGGYDTSGLGDFGGYTSFGDWGGSSIDDQVADAVAGVAAASLAGGDAGGWASPSGGFSSVDVGGDGFSFGGLDASGLGDVLGGADGWGSSVADMVGGGWGDAVGGGADLSGIAGDFGSSIAGSIGASGFGSGGGGGGGWDITPSGEPIASTGFSDLFTDSGRQPNMGPGIQNMSRSAFSDVPMQSPQQSMSASVPEMQAVSKAFKSMNSQLPAGVTSQPGMPNMYGAPQELGLKMQDRISPDIAKALPAPADVMEPSSPALMGFSYGQPKTDKIQDRIEPDSAPAGLTGYAKDQSRIASAPMEYTLAGKIQDRITPEPDQFSDRKTNGAYGSVDTSIGSVPGTGIPQNAQSMGAVRDLPSRGPAPMEYTPPSQSVLNRPDMVFGAPANLLDRNREKKSDGIVGSVVSKTGTPVTDRYGNAVTAGWPGADMNVYTDGYIAPVANATDDNKDDDTSSTEPYPTHAYPPYYPTWPYVSGYAPGGLAPWSWFQSLYAQS